MEEIGEIIYYYTSGKFFTTYYNINDGENLKGRRKEADNCEFND